MTMPTYDMTRQAKAAMRAIRDDDGRHWPLIASLGEFFPHSQGFAWLDDDDDPTVGMVFTSADGGWLGAADDAEFWQTVAGLDIEGQDRQAPDALISLLERLIRTWHDAAEEDAAPDPAGAARFIAIEPVPGSDHPGWWQGYDNLDQVWKYVHSGHHVPTDQSPGWTNELSPAVTPAEQDTAKPADEPAEQDTDLTAMLANTVAAMVDDVRALGVSEEELSDEEIIAALEEDMAAELAAA